MRVELLYWDGDPNYMTTRQRLVEVLTEDAFETPIQMVAVNRQDDAELLDFRGSPTIRIDGVDIQPDAEAAIGLRLAALSRRRRPGRPADRADAGQATDPPRGRAGPRLGSRPAGIGPTDRTRGQLPDVCAPTGMAVDSPATMGPRPR